MTKSTTQTCLKKELTNSRHREVFMEVIEQFRKGKIFMQEE